MPSEVLTPLERAENAQGKPCSDLRGSVSGVLDSPAPEFMIVRSSVIGESGCTMDEKHIWFY